MPRFGFGSPSGSKISLNSPKESSISRTKGSSSYSSSNNNREERIEQARKEKGSKERRRNFGFLKSGIGRTEKSSSENRHSISRRRDHAKQLANLAFSDDPTTATSSTSTALHDESPAPLFPANDAFSNSIAFSAPKQSSSKRNVVSRPRTNSQKSNNSSNSDSNSDDPFGMDPFASFDAFGTGATTTNPKKNTSSSNSNQFSEMDFFSTQMAGAVTPVHKSKSSSTRKARKPISLDHFFQDDSHSVSSAKSNSLSQSDHGSTSAAARRRMRVHMRAGAAESSASSVGSGTSTSLEFPPTHPSTNSSQLPPTSPTPQQNHLSKNRLAAYSRNSSGSLTQLSNQSSSNDLSFSPFRKEIGGGGSVTSSTASPSVNLFDSDGENGFTFDAFGLDESQVEKEVNDAMQDILVDGGFSIFVGKQKQQQPYSRQNSFTSTQDFSEDDSSSFVQHGWDSSPNASRTASPVPHGNGRVNNNSDSEGFVDGFRVAAPSTPQPSKQKQSSVQQRRLQRSLKKVGTTTPTRSNSMRQVMSEPPIQKQNIVGNNSNSFSAFDTMDANNPWQEDPFASSDGEQFADFSASARKLMYAETQSNVQDYYASSSMTAASNVLLDRNRKSPNALGGTPTSNKSQSRRRPSTATSFSDAKTDIGASRFSFETFQSSSPAFFELPPREQNDLGNETDESDDMDQMQDDLAHEFARDIVRKTISPRQEHFLQSDSNSSVSKRNRYFEQQKQQTTPQDYASQSINKQPPPSPQVRSTSSSPSIPPKRFGSFRSRYESQSKSKSLISQSPVDVGESSATDSAKWGSNAPIEEKKEEELAKPAPTPRKINSLKARWEAKTRPSAPSFATPKKNAVTETATTKTATTTKTIDNSLDMSTPDNKEKRLQTKNTNKFDTPKNYDETEPSTDPKAAGLERSGGRRGHEQQPLSNVRLSRGSPMTGNSQSEVGTSPYFLANVRLRKVASPGAFQKSPEKEEAQQIPQQLPSPSSTSAPSPNQKLTYRERRDLELKAQQEARTAAVATNLSPKAVERKMTYRERRELELKAQREKEDAKAAAEQNSLQSPISQKSPGTPRKLTYRERREMELKLQKEQEDKASSMSPKKDVAALIRKRIHANKSKTTKSREEVTNTSVSPFTSPSVVVEQEALFKYRDNTMGSHEEEDEDELQESPARNPRAALESMFAARGMPPAKKASPERVTGNPHEALENMFAARAPPPKKQSSPEKSENPHKALENMFAARAPPPKKQASPEKSENPHKALENMFAARAPPPKKQASPEKSENPHKALENMFAARAPPPTKQASPEKSENPHKALENMFAARAPPPKKQASPEKSENPHKALEDMFASRTAKAVDQEKVSQSDAKSMLSGFLSKRVTPALPTPAKEKDAESLQKHHVRSPKSSPSTSDDKLKPPSPPPATVYNAAGGIPPLKDDPKFERYFRMLKMGLPLEVAKHAMVRDGLDPSILDKDPNKPLVAGVPLKDDPKYAKYFKMLKIGISIFQVKHSMEMDGLNPNVMDQDHNLPVVTVEKKQPKKKKETHRRARLHWKTISNVVKNSLWANVEKEVDGIDIDEEEFNDLFQADLKASNVMKSPSSAKKKGAAVRVIDSKRANNGGIILARVKLTHDQMAAAVDNIDDAALTAEQIENVIEYLPTKEEREELQKYMLEGGQDAAQKFDGLCECEKFMVSMMTVKHAKRKIRALLFKLQFLTCMESIAKDAQVIDSACDELVNSNRLRQLLGIILQFGNRLNTAGNSTKKRAGGFSLESLSKLSQAKAFDKKTTFLHYIILIIQRNNELLLKYYDDIPTVLEAETVFWDQCQQDLEEVENQLENVRQISLHEARGKHLSKARDNSDDDSLGEIELTLEEEVVSLRATSTGLFTLNAIKQVSALREKIERTKAKCVRMNEYFGVTRKETEPQEIFSVFVNFTTDFKKAKEQVFSTAHKRLREDRKKARQQTPTKSKSLPSLSEKRAPPGKPLIKASSHQPNMNALFSDIQKRQPSSDNARESNGHGSRSDLLNSSKGKQPSSSSNTPSARTSLLSSIKERQSPSESSDPRTGLLSSIKQRQSPSTSSDARAGLRDSIKQRKTSSGSESSSGRSRLMDGIQDNHAPSENVMATSNGNRVSSPLDRKLLSQADTASKQQSVSTPTTTASSQDTSRAGSVRESMRQKALRRHRNYSAYSSHSSSSSIGESNSTSSQQVSSNPISSRSPREAMRVHHRRRLAEAARARNSNHAAAQGSQ